MTGPAEKRDSLMSPEDNRRMFNRLAGRYDLMNRLISLGMDRRWRRQAVEALGPTGDGRYLDVGCGTGDMAIEILRQSPASHVAGLDPAEGMLDVAEARLTKASLADRFSLHAGDATGMEFADGCFVGIVSAFCIRNIAHRARALTEMHRVLAPGGRVVLLELTVPCNSLLRPGHKLYSRLLVPLAGLLIAGRAEAYRYLVDSVEDFPRAAEVVALLAEAGFADAAAAPLSGGIVTIFRGTRTDGACARMGAFAGPGLDAGNAE